VHGLLPLLDFVLRAAAGQALWLPRDAAREEHRQRALELWYRGQPR
jgi:hypothetical protein